ncbi:MAG: hypothetical protein JNN12_13200 [Bacteroidetes Order II. Incertae sedis bacterium]|nr:hypothetical protein [Bacteroidetes Order II. bacterium]
MLRPVLNLCFLFLAFTLISCDSEDQTGKVTIQFIHQADGKTLDLNTSSFTNDAGNVYKVSLLEYITSNMALVGSDGKSVDLTEYHYVQLGNTGTLSLTIKGIKPDHFQGFKMVMGIPKTQNITGKLPNQQAYNNMEWPVAMGGGYHYMRFEGSYVNAGSSSTFAVHTGPNSGTDYSVSLSLPMHLHLTAGANPTVKLTMNVNEWLKNPTRYDFRDYPGNIMGNPTAQEILKNNGKDVFSVQGN